jgi:hypothetical protein
MKKDSFFAAKKDIFFMRYIIILVKRALQNNIIRMNFRIFQHSGAGDEISTHEI